MCGKPHFQYTCTILLVILYVLRLGTFWESFCLLFLIQNRYKKDVHFFLIREPSEDQVSSSIGGGGGRLPPPIPEEQTWAQGGRSRGGRQTSHTPCRPQGGRRIFMLLVSLAGFWIEHVPQIVANFCETWSQIGPTTNSNYVLEGPRNLLGGSQA